MKELSLAFSLFVGITISSYGQLSRLLSPDDFDSTYTRLSQSMDLEDRLESIEFQKDSVIYALTYGGYGTLVGYIEMTLDRKMLFNIWWTDTGELKSVGRTSLDSAQVWDHSVSYERNEVNDFTCANDTCVYVVKNFEGHVESKYWTGPNKYELSIKYHDNGRILCVDSLFKEEYLYVSYYSDGAIQEVCRKISESSSYIGEYKNYYPNGKLKESGFYGFGEDAFFTEPQGKWYIYHEDGTVEER